jgi:hypothetical protein
MPSWHGLLYSSAQWKHGCSMDYDGGGGGWGVAIRMPWDGLQCTFGHAWCLEMGK